MSEDTRKLALNIGCGDKVRDDTDDILWVNMDIRPLPRVHVVRDLRRGIPFNNDWFDYILADNVLEHMDHDDAVFLLNEMFRVCKPGGHAMIIVPHAFSQGAHQDPTHKSYWVPRSALYWNQYTTPHGGMAVGISANWDVKSALVTGDMATEAFIEFQLVANKG